MYLKVFKILSYSSLFFIVLLLSNTTIINTIIYSIYCIMFLFFIFIVFIKINSIFVKVISVLWYLGYVLSLSIIYSNIEIIAPTGWRAVGKFDFSTMQLLSISSTILFYFLFFIISSLLIDKFLIKKYYYDKSVQVTHKALNLNILITMSLIVGLIIQFPISTFMFEHNIGIVGIVPKKLPYSLAGILYYYRSFIFPGLMFLLIYGSIEKKYSLILVVLLFLETIYSGILSASRSLLILHIFPVIYYFYIKRNKYMIYFVSFLMILAFSVISISRNYIYLIDDFSGIDIISIVTYLFNQTDASFSQNVFFAVFTIIGRIGGVGEFIPTYYNLNNIEFVDKFYFIQNLFELNSIFNIEFNVAENIFGIKLPPDKAYGIELDTFSYIYLSSKNYFDIFFNFFIFSLAGILSEKFLNIMLRNVLSNNNFIIIFHVIIILSIPNPHIKVLLFKGIPIILIMYLLINLIFFKKYKYKVSY